MGRKKKNIETQATTTQNSAIGYLGKVKVSVMKGKKVCKSVSFKNNGRWPLFYFLSLCLSGNFSLAEAYRPIYIQLFHAGDAGDPIPTDAQSVFTLANKKSSVAVMLRDLPTVKNSANNYIGESSITFKWAIPFTYFDSADAINALGLYCKTYALADNDINNPSAFIFVQDAKDNKKLGDLISDDMRSSNMNEYSLFIEWTLQVQNVQNVSSNN